MNSIHHRHGDGGVLAEQNSVSPGGLIAVLAFALVCLGFHWFGSPPRQCKSGAARGRPPLGEHFQREGNRLWRDTIPADFSARGRLALSSPRQPRRSGRGHGLVGRKSAHNIAR